jgi:hypothetical protein
MTARLKTLSAFALAACLAPAQVHQVPASPGWFPSEPAQLSKLLDQTLAIAEKRSGAAPPRKKLLALIVPHAGLAYSGGIAASAFRRLDHPKNVILLGFSHRRPLTGISVPDLDAYATPVGTESQPRGGPRTEVSSTPRGGFV